MEQQGRTLRFRSETELDDERHVMRVHERYTGRLAGQAVEETYHFTMRCWTPDKLREHSTAAGFAVVDIGPGSRAGLPADRLSVVAETGHVTLAERGPAPDDYPPGFDTSVLVPGSFVFEPPDRPVSVRDHAAWWRFVPGACWRAPLGPGSTVDELGAHPVVHIAYEDAEAYVRWAGKALPAEAEWEYAARGGLDGALFTWGDEHEPGGAPPAKVWRGRFPYENLATDGHERTAPVASYPPNGFGLFDMAGNVRVIEGGSHLCAPSYCLRYRPAARLAQPVDTTTSHVGFGCVARPGSVPD